MATPVKIIEDFLSEEDCTHLIETYKDKVCRSTVVLSDGSHSSDSSRTSSTFYIPNSDTIIIKLKEKVANFLSIDTRQIEGIQFLRYVYGERYVYHHDYLPNNPPNQRVHTIILYLNDLNEGDGGETSFFHYNLRVLPKQGRAVWFRNMDDSGKLINESLHSGEPILKNGVVKYALNVWTKQYNL